MSSAKHFEFATPGLDKLSINNFEIKALKIIIALTTTATTTATMKQTKTRKFHFFHQDMSEEWEKAEKEIRQCLTPTTLTQYSHKHYLSLSLFHTHNHTQKHTHINIHIHTYRQTFLQTLSYRDTCE